jgi:adenylate cyclase
MANDPQDPTPDATTEQWRRMLTGEEPGIAEMRRRWNKVPSSPRCKMCAAPFGGLGRVATRLIMHGPSAMNPLMCNVCFGQLRQHPGGAEIDLSILFADVRDSTGLAERLGAQRFRHLIQEFYRLSARSVEHQDGIVDKYLGDGVMALFIPVLTGEDHAGRAIAAATDLLRAVTASRELSDAGIGVGVGVHRGMAFTGGRPTRFHGPGRCGQRRRPSWRRGQGRRSARQPGRMGRSEPGSGAAVGVGRPRRSK